MTEQVKPYPMPSTEEYQMEDKEREYKRDEYEKEMKHREPYKPPRAYDNLDLPHGKIKGYFDAYTVDYDRDPNRVFERNQPWYIVAKWSISGTIVTALGGTWMLTAVAESIGPSRNGTKSEVELFSLPVEVNSVDPSTQRDYEELITVAADRIPQDGAYKIVLLLDHFNTGASGVTRKTRLSGFVEIPMVSFYSFD